MEAADLRTRQRPTHVHHAPHAMHNIPSAKPTCRERCRERARCRRSMPDESNFQAKPAKKSYWHWGVVFVSICLVGAWVIPEIQGRPQLAYSAPSVDYLKRKHPAIRISGIDFVSDSMRERTQRLGEQLVLVCNERSDDVVFAFQLSDAKRPREDHVFAICSPPRVLGNAELISRSEEEILCTEEFGGHLRQVRRPSSISVRAIDVRDWAAIEHDVTDFRESCVLQHAIEVIESKWL